jgi:hypothetical protein
MPREINVSHLPGGKGRSRAVARAVTAIAARQHGVVAHRQIVAAGVTQRELERLAWLRPVHRGVSKLGAGAMTPDARWLAAVLAVGDDACLHGRSAAAALGLATDDRRVVHTGCPRRVRRRAGIRVHLADTSGARTCRGIPCPEPNAGIAQFAATATRRELERALDQAAYERTLDLSLLHSHAARNGRGSRALKEVLESHTPGSTITRSEMEERFLALVDRFGLPRPDAMNVAHVLPGGRAIRIDALYGNLAIELDGRGGHAHVKAFRADRERDRGLTLQGHRPVRFTYADLTRDAARTARELSSLREFDVFHPGGGKR